MIYILTAGEYSDFHIEGLYEGPEGIDFDSLKRDYLQANPEARSKKRTYGNYIEFDTDEFHKFVFEKTGLKEIGYDELWFGADTAEKFPK